MTELESTRAKLKCLEMVEGTKLNWWDVVRFDGCNSGHYLSFGSDRKYEFALGVVEGKPVWEGDRLYDSTGCVFTAKTIEDGSMCGYITPNIVRVMPIELVSWNPPSPKTVMVGLPIEDVEYYASERKLTLAEIEGMIDRRALACKKALKNLK